jgi:hypothetical protein
VEERQNHHRRTAANQTNKQLTLYIVFHARPSSLCGYDLGLICSTTGFQFCLTIRSPRPCLIWGATFQLFWGANTGIIWSDLSDNRVFRLSDNAKDYGKINRFSPCLFFGFRTFGQLFVYVSELNGIIFKKSFILHQPSWATKP